ncbi:MAG: FHA domain-containing protein [Longimicrobiales bacterium]
MAEPAPWPVGVEPPVPAASNHDERDAAAQMMELLPGYLEVVGGPGRGARFGLVRAAGEARPIVTIGRAPGGGGPHIQLASPTVSRVHARLLGTEEGWRIENLSATNPVIVDGTELRVPGEWRILNEGTEMRLGAVTLRFRCGR